MSKDGAVERWGCLNISFSKKKFKYLGRTQLLLDDPVQDQDVESYDHLELLSATFSVECRTLRKKADETFCTGWVLQPRYEFTFPGIVPEWQDMICNITITELIDLPQNFVPTSSLHVPHVYSHVSPNVPEQTLHPNI